MSQLKGLDTMITSGGQAENFKGRVVDPHQSAKAQEKFLGAWLLPCP
jgi:hypothetical protein